MTLSSTQVATLLGWQAVPNAQTICRGYYQEQPIITPPNATAAQYFIRSDSAILRRNKPNELIGNVSVTQIGKQVTADHAYTYSSQKSIQIEQLDLVGNVRLREPGFLAVGSKAHINVPKKSSTLHDATFRYQIPAQPRTNVYDQQHKLKAIYIEGHSYRGNAIAISQTKPKHIELHHVAMTTCDPFSNAWLLKSGTLQFDREAGMGTAHNAWLFLHGVPVFYTPFIRFPIDNRRQSGFLMPGFAYSQDSGSTLSVPYYWNMAPNYDMTITPNIISQRGAKIDSLFRYLDDLGSGQVYFSELPHDRAFAQFQESVANGGEYSTADPNAINSLVQSSTNRLEFAWQDTTHYSPYLQSDVNIDYVNDDYYLQDFPNSPLRGTSDFADILPTTQLIQNVDLNYATEHWSVDTDVENFQTLHPVNLPITQDQYARLPDTTLTGIYPSLLPNLNLNINSEFSRFTDPLFERDFPTNLPSSVTGNRYNFAPAMDLYLAKAWGYIDPRITLTQTFYQLENPAQNPTDASLSQQSYMERTVPIFDFDTGMYFDRGTSFGTSNYTQTLEPRLFYLYAPYVNQANIPTFDTSMNPAVTFDQLFNINRFQGDDRYGDANQITLGFTSRFIKNASGYDVLDFDIGQIYYFANRQVHSPDESPTMLMADNQRYSPLVGDINWQFRQSWNLTGNIAYDTNQGYLQNSNLNVAYSADTQHFLTSGVTYVKDGESDATDPNLDLKQVNLGAVWPINLQWHTIAGLAFNLSRHFPQTYVYGLEYDSCCWAVRLVGSKRFIGFQPNNTTAPLYDPGIYLQFILTGLTAVGTGVGGSSANSIIQYAIPGYTDTFGQNPLLLSNPT